MANSDVVRDADKKVENFMNRSIKPILSIKSGAPTPLYSWTDETCQKKVDEIGYEVDRSDPKKLAKLIYPFICYYCNGIFDGAFSLGSAVSCAILIAITPKSRKTHEFIFKDKNNGSLTFLDQVLDLPIDADLVVNHENFINQKPESIRKYIEKALEPKGPSDTPNVAAALEDDNSYYNYGDDDEKAFRTYMKKSFNHLLSIVALDESSIDFLKFLSTLALISLRGMVKSKEVLISAFSRHKFMGNIKNVAQISGTIPYFPPCEKFIDKVLQDLTKNSSLPRLIFTIITGEYVNRKRLVNPQNQEICSLFQFGILTSTSLNGLIPIKLLREAKKITNLEPVEIASYYYYTNTESQWSKVFKFLDEQAADHVYESSAWCRVIDDNYYADVHHTQAQAVCVFLAALLASSKGYEGIWKSNWAATARERCVEAEMVGDRLFKFLRLPKSQDILPTKTQMLLKGDKRYERMIRHEEASQEENPLPDYPPRF